MRVRAETFTRLRLEQFERLLKTIDDTAVFSAG